MLLAELDVALDLGRHFDELGVPWLIGGSVASSLLGEPRATVDIDLVADLRPEHVTPLYQRLVGTYYIDEDALRWAVSTRRTFNVINLASMIKADVYCAKQDELSRAQLDRRVFVEAGAHRLPVCSAEDIVLQKLLWFEEGKRVSDRQWRDLLGVVRVHAGRLDRAYLDKHAAAHGLTELLARLLALADSP